jgi:hypothetical protein
MACRRQRFTRKNYVDHRSAAEAAVSQPGLPVVAAVTGLPATPSWPDVLHVGRFPSWAVSAPTRLAPAARTDPSLYADILARFAATASATSAIPASTPPSASARMMITTTTEHLFPSTRPVFAVRCRNEIDQILCFHREFFSELYRRDLVSAVGAIWFAWKYKFDRVSMYSDRSACAASTVWSRRPWEDFYVIRMVFRLPDYRFRYACTLSGEKFVY